MITFTLLITVINVKQASEGGDRKTQTAKRQIA